MASQVGVLGLCLAASLSAHAGDAAPRYSPTQYFKNYAFSTCVAEGYKADEVVKDSAAAARGYLELGAFPLEAHTEATRLAKTFLDRPYASKSGEPLTLMKCLDFFHSQDLERLARRYRGKP